MTSLEGGADTVQQREPVSGSRNHGHIGLFSVRKNDPEIILVVGMNGSERVVECYIIGSLGSASYDTTPRSPTITAQCTPGLSAFWRSDTHQGGSFNVGTLLVKDY